MAKLPEKIGKYKVLSLIGKGGMGIVYAAMHPTLKRKVILKKLTIKDKEFRERFRLEAHVMMDLRSDFIVDMYDHFREGNSYYIAMEFIDGISLSELIEKKGALTFKQVIYIMASTAKALVYIHGRGIIHRDIKPSNIYISHTGDIKLGDFGIASSTSRDVKITDSGAAMGTPSYMAPEQFVDSSNVDKQADVFSFGVTFYESYSGKKPFPAQEYGDVKMQIKKGKYKSIGRHIKKTPSFFKWIIFRSLLVNRNLRAKDLNGISKSLESHLKKYGVNEMRLELSQTLSDNKKKSSLTKMDGKSLKQKKSNKKVIWALLLSIFIVLSSLFSFFYFYFANSYGLLDLQLLPYSQNSKYGIYSEKLEKIDLIREGLFNKSGKGTFILKEGSYRIQIRGGSLVSWRTIYVSSINSIDGVRNNLTVLSRPIENNLVDYEIRVKDRFTGKGLNQSLGIFLKKGETWVKIKRLGKDYIKTGEISEIKIIAYDYSHEFYRFQLEPYETSLILDVRMTPIGARLLLHPKEENIHINGLKKYFSLKTLRFEEIPQKINRATTLHLLAGKYTITYEIHGKTVQDQIILKSGEQTIY